MTIKNILITGGTGQVGNALSRLIWPSDVRLHTPDRNTLNLAQKDSISTFLEREMPLDAIINCAAFTDVDRSEIESKSAKAINADAPSYLAAYAKINDIPLVHVSTDYVFDGKKDSAYLESDSTMPLGTYGLTKLEGEKAIFESGARTVVLRTAWVVSIDGKNFLKTMLRVGQERDEINVVFDQVGCPTNAVDLADALQTVTLQLLSKKPVSSGIYNFVNTGKTSWHGFAEHIFLRAHEAGWKTPKLNPSTTANYPTLATRPCNSELDTTKFTEEFGIKPRSWKTAVDDILKILL